MPGGLRVLFRGLTKACARCGSRNLFSSWFKLRERCPRCGRTFDLEDGYWLGAIAINLGVTEVVFIAAFVGAMVGFWPDVPWGWLTGAGIALNLVVPLVFYPFSKTLWMSVDALIRRIDPQDAADWIEPAGRGR